MSPESQLNDREKLILRAVVHSYITTAEPVGSRTIVKRFQLDLSPATVRNTMADLEETGFLKQLHTSSGRVPTDLGYRYYVDYLMRVQELTLSERQRIERELSEKLNDVDDLMRQTSHLLALVTHQTGIVEAPAPESAEVRRIDLIPVSDNRAAVLIADSLGRVRTTLVALEEPIPAMELTRLSGFLNDELAGIPTSGLTMSLRAHMQEWLYEQRRLAEQALRVLDLLPAGRPEPLFLEGTAQLMEQPEFNDMAKAREVLGLLDERERLVELLRAGVTRAESGAHSSVVIGLEAAEMGHEDISVVTSPYRVQGKAVGRLGVLGPRRMPYPRLTSVVDYTAAMLSRLLDRLTG
ncbi:MAG TPA: heat-inducible transcriptional repressor HrcA [Candidatus Hydrogenedentes bacterium]|nr:heat-inducible transcriptional repressor HrcA [Candidatus Hydrogenedentota bacterium]HPG66785.1 heat-inducible transcriptional repressor HrcA [Candidatus Hydrogenedentota bacterium]